MTSLTTTSHRTLGVFLVWTSMMLLLLYLGGCVGGGVGAVTILPQVSVSSTPLWEATSSDTQTPAAPISTLPKRHLQVTNSTSTSSTNNSNTSNGTTTTTNNNDDDDGDDGQNDDTSFPGGVCYSKVPYDPLRHQPVYTVGVLAIRGFPSAYAEFNTTFNEYLTATAGQRFDPPIRFEMKPLDFITLFSDVEDRLVDFIYVNPSAFSCIESEYEALSLVSQVSRREVSGQTYDLKEFGGVMFARHDRSEDIRSVQDLRNKVIAAASISGLGSGQMQFKRMIDEGLNYLQDPRQLVFTSNQGKVVRGVANGDFDVGFVRTDQLERTRDEYGNLYNVSDMFSIIAPLDGLEIDGTAFPLESSTVLYPEWNLAALTHVNEQVSREVQRAMLSVADFARVGDVVQDCYAQEAANNNNMSISSTLDCDQWTLADMAAALEAKTNGTAEIRCDTTRSKALIASEARDKGKYSAWVPSLSYMQLRTMQEATGFISKQDGTWRCVRSTELYDAISCPAGTYRKTKLEVDAGCSLEGLDCSEGFQCFCRPCEVPVENNCENAILIGDNCVSLAIFLPSLILPLFLLVALVAHFYVEYKRKQNDSVWTVKPKELVFDNPPQVIGKGTFGLVLLAEYRGTDVAVKRVIPPGVTNNSVSLFDAKLSPQDVEDQMGTKTAKDTVTPAMKSTMHPALLNALSEMHQNKVDAIGLKSMTADMLSPKEYHFNHSDDCTQHEELKPEPTTAKRALWCRNQEEDYQQQLKKDFVHEIRQLARLRHPNVTTVMGAVMPSARDEPMLVMEYMRQGSLYDVLQDTSITLRHEQILTILQDVAQGLRFLHSADPQVIHGDLKSANVLVDTNFCAKVTDFGLSAKKNVGAVGTPYWMAPELLRGKSKNTAASDIFAFGIVIYEAYTRKLPYEGLRYDEVIRNVCDPYIKQRPPVPLNCPPKVAKLMKECLLHNPDERPASDMLDVALKVEMKVSERTSRLEQLNKDLEEANHKIASASKMQLEHFACMSHEIRTPLNCIIGLSSLLEESDLDPMQRESMEMIISSGTLLRQIVDDVLDYSKLASGNAEVLIKRTNLQETLNAVVHLIRTSRVTTEKQLRIRTIYDPVLPEWIDMDGRRIQQILYNLLGNAIKFSKPRTDVELSIHVEDGTLLYSIKDYGKGIEEEDRDKIFEPFVQTKGGLTNAESGTGLGLPITKKLTEALGGRISVESEVGSWTEFSIEFPFHNEIADAANLSSRLSSARVLFVSNGNDHNTPFMMEVLTYFKVDFEYFPSLRELVEASTSDDTSLSAMAEKPHICLVHEDLYDQGAFSDLAKKRSACLVTFGPDFKVGTGRRHYRSLTNTFPSVLMENFATYAEEVRTNETSIPTGNGDARACQIGTPFAAMRIMVAEDNMVNQKVFSRILKRLGVEYVVFVGNGKEAVEREAQEKFDLIFMDMQMPVMDGIAACKEIGRRNDTGRHPVAKVIFCTAHVSDSFRQYAMENGAIGYLPKPCTVGCVKECLREFDLQHGPGTSRTIIK